MASARRRAASPRPPLEAPPARPSPGTSPRRQPGPPPPPRLWRRHQHPRPSTQGTPEPLEGCARCYRTRAPCSLKTDGQGCRADRETEGRRTGHRVEHQTLGRRQAGGHGGASGHPTTLTPPRTSAGDSWEEGPLCRPHPSHPSGPACQHPRPHVLGRPLHTAGVPALPRGNVPAGPAQVWHSPTCGCLT